MIWHGYAWAQTPAWSCSSLPLPAANAVVSLALRARPGRPVPIEGRVSLSQAVRLGAGGHCAGRGGAGRATARTSLSTGRGQDRGLVSMMNRRVLQEKTKMLMYR